MQSQNARDQTGDLALGTGLVDVLVRRQADIIQPVLDLVGAGRQEYNRSLAVLTEFLEKFDPVHARHMAIQDEKIGRHEDQLGQGDEWVVVCLDGISLVLERKPQRGQDILFVLYDRNVRHGRFGNPLPARK